MSLFSLSKVTQDAEYSCSQAQNLSSARTEERWNKDFERGKKGKGGWRRGAREHEYTGKARRLEDMRILLEVIELIDRPRDQNRRDGADGDIQYSTGGGETENKMKESI